ncbi:IS200/IS605 family transposase [Gemmata sp.]|uniref:IS200/IS605 family transposase n=1 Tax=Gemmata sp. TaxID=1914242 RepID=UPI003F722295
MPQSYTSLYYHLVFSTRNREATISPEIGPRLYDYFGGLVRAERGVLLAVGGVSDHVHLLVRLSQTRAIADVMRVIKANASKWVHETFPNTAGVWWQGGYGAFTVGKSAVDEVEAYIANQEAHHRGETFQTEFRGLLDEHGVEYDERYLWD